MISQLSTLLLFTLLTSSSSQSISRPSLDCTRIHSTFCCTTRIRQQCEKECFGVQCEQNYYQKLFSLDFNHGKATSQDGNAFVERPEVVNVDILPPPQRATPPPFVSPTPPAWVQPEVTSTIPFQLPEVTSQPTVSTRFPTLIPFEPSIDEVGELKETKEWTTPPPFVQKPTRPRTTPNPRIIKPPESLVNIGDYDTEESVTSSVVDQQQRLQIVQPRTFTNSNSTQPRPPFFNTVIKGPGFAVDGSASRNNKELFTKSLEKIVNSFTASAVEKQKSEIPKFQPPVVPPPAQWAIQTTTATVPQKRCGVAPDFLPCVPANIASQSLLACCRAKNMPAGCLQLCRYDITQGEVRAAMDRGQCGILSVQPFLECAAQNMDNTECCQHKQLAQKSGPQCEQFCRPSRGLTVLGIQHIVCGNVIGELLQCHHSGIRM